MKQLFRRLIHLLRGEWSNEKLVRMGMRVGENFHRMGFTILDPSHCWLIHIGNNVTLSSRVHILAHDASTKQWLGYSKIGRVTIGDNVFIGAGSIVLPGVSIGSNCVIGAGSVITKDVPTDSVMAGNPAKYVCSTWDYVQKHSERMKNSPVYSKSFSSSVITEKQKAQMWEDLNNGLGYVD